MKATDRLVTCFAILILCAIICYQGSCLSSIDREITTLHGVAKDHIAHLKFLWDKTAKLESLINKESPPRPESLRSEVDESARRRAAMMMYMASHKKTQRIVPDTSRGYGFLKYAD